MDQPIPVIATVRVRDLTPDAPLTYDTVQVWRVDPGFIIVAALVGGGALAIPLDQVHPDDLALLPRDA